MNHSAAPPDCGSVIYPETGLSVVSIAGTDSTKFLNAQSSARLSDIEDAFGTGALADARGRVLLVFRYWRRRHDWCLLVPAAETEWLHDYLSRFVFRARVNIAVETDWRILGIAGASARNELEDAGIAVHADGHVTVGERFAILALDHTRRLLCGEAERIDALEATLRMRLPTGDEDAWRLLRLAAGEPEIRAATRGRFLPQMLGLVELGAVSFDKGCYPGQEIIARIQHRGRVKRQLALLEWTAPLPQAGTTVSIDGQTVEALDGSSRPCGPQWLQAVIPWPPARELARRLANPQALETE